MPKGYPNKKTPPPDGGSVQTESPISASVSRMSGFSSEQEMKDSLPDSTLTSEPDEKPRRKRRTKEEILAAKGGAGNIAIDADPNMSDPVYRKAVEKMRSAGISTTVKSGFKTAAIATNDANWELDDEEIDDIDGFSYVMSKKFPLMDPTRHWISMLLYFVALMGTMIFKRAVLSGEDSFLGKFTADFKKAFGFGEKPALDAQQLEDMKAHNV
jgi:hypothetical protein